MNYICKACGKEFKLTECQERKYKRFKKKGIIKEYCCSQKCRSSLISPETKKIMYEKSSKSLKKYWDKHPEKKEILSIRSSNRTEEERIAIGKGVHEYWNNASKEEKQAFGKKISDSWNNKTEIEKQKTIEKKKEIVTNIWKNRNNDEKKKITDKFKLTWSNKTEEELKEFSKNVSIGHLKIWENTSLEERKEVFKRIHKAMKNNGSYKGSKAEDQFYEIMRSKNVNIERQYYKDGFVFDFRIDNTLIEFNGKFYHNYKPFKNTEEDLQQYYELINKGGKYKSIAYKWRFTDVGKLEYCRENDINYIVIYYLNNAKFDKFSEDICHKVYDKGQHIIDYEERYKFKKKW